MMLLSLLSLFLLSIAKNVFSLERHGNIRIDTRAPKCSTLECEMIRNIFVHDLNKQAKPCEDLPPLVCTGTKFVFSHQSTPNYATLMADVTNFAEFGDSIRNYLTGVDTADQNYSKSLKIEQKLFQQCMEFQNDPQQQMAAMKEVMDRVMQTANKTRNNVTWQIIDKELNGLDSEHAFYEIKVSRNPLRPHENIITLQPPSILSLVKKYYFRLGLDKGDLSNVVKIIHPTNTLFKEKLVENKKEIEGFFIQFAATLTGLNISDSNLTTSKFTELPNIIMSINEWNNTYNFNGTIPEIASIDWLKVFNREFQTIGIDVNGTDLVYIKNKWYFERLADITRSKSSSTLMTAVQLIHGFRTILMHKVLPINKEFSSDDEKNIFRSNSCVLDTPLYGVSYQILRSWENDQSISTQREVLRNIVDGINSFNGRSKLSNVKKDFYSKRLVDLTSILFENKWNASYISNYYENYTLTDNYLINLINYHNMLKRKELSALRDSPDNTRNVPFSIHSWDNPRDKIVTYARMHYIKINEVILGYLPTFPVEFHYGAYGTKVANYLYKALNDDKLSNGLTFEMLYPIPFTYVKYKTDIIDCFYPGYFDVNSNDRKPSKVDDVKSFFIELFEQLGSELAKTLTGNFYRMDDVIEYFGVRIAYDSMQKIRKNNKNDQFLKEVGLTSDQLFYMSYAKTICEYQHAKPSIQIKSYMLSEKYLEAFQCPSQNKDVENCNTLFEVESNFRFHNNATVHENT